MAKKSTKAVSWDTRRDGTEGFEAFYRGMTLKVAKVEGGYWTAVVNDGAAVHDQWGTRFSSAESAMSNAVSLSSYLELGKEIPADPKYINRVEFLERVSAKHTWVGETTSREEVRYKGDVLGKGIVGARNPVMVARMPDGTIELFFNTDDGCWRLGNIPREAVRFYVD